MFHLPETTDRIYFLGTRDWNRRIFDALELVGTVEVKGLPTPEILQQVKELGQKLAGKIKEKGKLENGRHSAISRSHLGRRFGSG